MSYESQREKSDNRLGMASGIMGIFFGLLITFFGFALLKKDNFGIAKLQKFTAGSDDLLLQLFGGICVLYGLWRLFRAYQKIKGN
jgi:uncharacterized membrane protein